jgi:hypothetical protein
MSAGELFVESALFGMAVRWGAGRLVTWECLVGRDQIEIERADAGEITERSANSTGHK